MYGQSLTKEKNNPPLHEWHIDKTDDTKWDCRWWDWQKSIRKKHQDTIW